MQCFKGHLHTGGSGGQPLCGHPQTHTHTKTHTHARTQAHKTYQTRKPEPADALLLGPD